MEEGGGKDTRDREREGGREDARSIGKGGAPTGDGGGAGGVVGCRELPSNNKQRGTRSNSKK